MKRNVYRFMALLFLHPDLAISREIHDQVSILYLSSWMTWDGPIWDAMGAAFMKLLRKVEPMTPA